MKAIWNDEVIAESDDTVVVEGNHYFPRESLVDGFFEASAKTTVCGWKGTANYFNVSVNGDTNADAAFYYASPKEKAQHIQDRVAFWRGVKVTD